MVSFSLKFPLIPPAESYARSSRALRLHLQLAMVHKDLHDSILEQDRFV